jgi:hypothetical protein
MDRKVRRTLTIVAAVLLVVIALAVRSYFARISEEKALAVPAERTDERLVGLDKDMMIVQPEALGTTLAAWGRSRNKTLNFELSDKSFQANSAAPTPMTVTRVGQVAAVAKTNPAVKVHILEPAQFASPAVEHLDEERALRLRHDLIASGVGETRVTIEEGREDVSTANSAHLAVLLSK